MPGSDTVRVRVGGLVASTALPTSSVTTHKEVDGHETSQTSVLPSTLERVQAPAPPVGLVEVTLLPASSPATQSDEDGHETP